MTTTARAANPSVGNGKADEKFVVAKPPLDIAVDHLLKYFTNRQDKLYFWQGKYPSPCIPADVRAALMAHVGGKTVDPAEITYSVKDKTGKVTTYRRASHHRLGTLSPIPGPDGLTRFGCVDCDGGDHHSRSLQDPYRAALRILARLEAIGLTGVLESSGSAKGWHVWLLFSVPVSAAIVRKVLFACCPLDEPLVGDSDEKPAKGDPSRNIGLEVFPKQDSLPDDGTGNQVWYPYWHGAAEGGNLFYYVNEDGEPVAGIQDVFPTHTRDELDSALREVGQSTEAKAEQPTTSNDHYQTDGWTQRATGWNADDERVSADYLLQLAARRVVPGQAEFGRNDTGLWLAIQLRDNGYSESEASPTMREYAASFVGHNPPYGDHEALSSLAQAFKRPARQPWSRAAKRRGYDPVPSLKMGRIVFNTDKNKEGSKSTTETAIEPDAYLTAEQFARGDFRLRWLIRRLLVAGQPVLVGGPRKSLKTSILLDLALSLGSGTCFLGNPLFEIYKKARVLVISCESGAHTLQETARRICVAKGIQLEDSDTRWWFDNYQFASELSLARLNASLRHHKPEVAVFDPTYLMLLSGVSGKGLQAGNLFDIGPLLLRVTQICLNAGVTPILAHHAKKNHAQKNSPNDPMDLDDLAFSGFAEFARQWLLISRREPYEPGSGSHRLLLNAGGSCGQGGLWQLDIEEGTLSDDFSGRRWEVSVNTCGTSGKPGEERITATVKTHGTRVLEALDRLTADKRIAPVEKGVGNAATYNEVRDEAGLNAPNMRRAVNALLRESVVEEQTVLKPIGAKRKGTLQSAGLRRKSHASENTRTTRTEGELSGLSENRAGADSEYSDSTLKDCPSCPSTSAQTPKPKKKRKKRGGQR